MSEWYENKTIEQLDGKRVRVEYENGTVLEGKISTYPSIASIVFDKDCSHAIFKRSGLGSAKYEMNAKSVTLLDDDNMTRIDDIDYVREGDIFVGVDGQQFKILCVNSVDEMYVTKLQFGKVELWMDRRYFAYALHPKPQLPTEPGLYKDTADDTRLWIRDETESLPWTLVIKDWMAHVSIYSNEEMFASLHGATLYPVEIKRVES